jgi:hypothetical protein
METSVSYETTPHHMLEYRRFVLMSFRTVNMTYRLVLVPRLHHSLYWAVFLIFQSNFVSDCRCVAQEFLSYRIFCYCFYIGMPGIDVMS